MNRKRKKISMDDKRPLVRFLMSANSTIVCSTDSMYGMFVHKDRCMKCGRDIVCDRMFDRIPNKLCIACVERKP